jgi:hypothetical protein
MLTLSLCKDTLAGGSRCLAMVRALLLLAIQLSLSAATHDGAAAAGAQAQSGCDDSNQSCHTS